MCDYKIVCFNKTLGRFRPIKGVFGVSVVEIFLITELDCRSITAKNFVTSVKKYLEDNQKASPLVSDMITCRKEDTLKDAIIKLDSKEIHRIYVVDEEGNLEGVITLRDIISRIVHEPHGYFGDFFDGVLPLPANSRV